MTDAPGDEPPFTEDRRALQGIPQLPDVARPVIPKQRVFGVAREPCRRTTEALADVLQKRAAQRENVTRPLAKRRQPDVEHLQPVEEVFPKIAAFHRLLQVAVRRRDHAHVGLQRTRRAEPLEFPLLQHAKELCLRGRTHFRHFIEKKHAPGGELDLSGLGVLGAGERAPLVQTRLSIRRRTMPIIFITGHGDVPMSVRAMKAGALEFLTKPFDDEELLAAIRHALEVSDEARREEAVLQDLRDRYATLTPRERQVMTLVVSGLLNKQVADELAITEITVKSHRGQVMRKMNASSFAELVNMDAALHPGSRATSSRVP